MTATLFVVATPLGNLRDFSPRAADCLRESAVIYAEDTRRSRILLQQLQIPRPLRSLHCHNEASRSEEILELLKAGQSVCLLTDAGTPAVSDPGATVVAAAHAAGCKVSPIAGPSALTAALSVAGFGAAAGAALFLGFLPARGAEKQRALAQIDAHDGVVILFEAPHRCAKTLALLNALDPERIVCLCREMTKMFEEVRRSRVADLCAWADGRNILGEITLVLGPRTKLAATADDAAMSHALARCMSAGMRVRDAATAVAAILEISRRTVYRRALEMDKLAQPLTD